MKILGLDFGGKRIGLAISDETGRLARGYGMIEIKEIKEVIGKIKEICRKEKIREIVVGLPLTLKGEEGRQVEKTKKFVSEMQKELSLPIILEDERFSTKEAEKILRQQGLKAMKKGKIDTLSAVLILRQYLERENV